jgi:hypothetical protein
VMNKTFRIFLQNGLSADIVAAKIGVREWREGDPLLGESVFAASTEDGSPVAVFRPEAVIGYAIGGISPTVS